MKLSKHSLSQLNDTYLASLTPDQLLQVSSTMLSDLKEAIDRLGQNSTNSSRPSSTEPLWDRALTDKPDDNGDDDRESPSVAEQADKLTEHDDELSGTAAAAASSTGQGHSAAPSNNAASGSSPTSPAKRSRGKQVGAPGHGRHWKPPITNQQSHQATHCAACGVELPADAPAKAYTAFDSVDIEWGASTAPGCQVYVTRHTLLDTACRCGHLTRAEVHRQTADTYYVEYDSVEVTEWRLLGPNLASLVVHLKLRMRLSLKRIQELLNTLLGLPVSTGTLQACIEEAGAASAPLEDDLVNDLLESCVLHVDETGWRESGRPLWLWTFTCAETVAYFIGDRSRAMVEAVLGTRYSGDLMTDGYSAYRRYEQRLRCWAHLYRKGRGLRDSTDEEARMFGFAVMYLLDTLENAIYQWREQNDSQEETEWLLNTHGLSLDNFRKQCEVFGHCGHKKTRTLAKEFLNDWQAIFRVVRRPYLPLTNNEAERSLRHWVIARKINLGTQSPRGSRVFALLAGVLDTCRKRGACSWRYLGRVLQAARRGVALPPLPRLSSIAPAPT